MKAIVLATVLASIIVACGPRHHRAVPPPGHATPAPASTEALPGDAPPLVKAIRDSLAYLKKDGDDWMEGRIRVQEGSGCVSCHHVTFALWSHREAARAGVEFDPAPLEDLEQRAIAFQSSLDEVVPASQLILAGAHTPHEVEVLRDEGEAAGYWRAKGQFPFQRRGEAEGDAVATMWALVALDWVDSLDEATAERRERALAWLAGATEGVSNEWTAARLIVEHRAGHDDRVATLRKRLLDTQQADGGWGWLGDDPSNPYSTGQTLYSLVTVGGDGIEAAVDRGVGYLLASQNADGTWTTPSRYTSAKESEDRDYIYQYWGTAWASMGLSRVLAGRR